MDFQAIMSTILIAEAAAVAVQRQASGSLRRPHRRGDIGLIGHRDSLLRLPMTRPTPFRDVGLMDTPARP